MGTNDDSADNIKPVPANIANQKNDQSFPSSAAIPLDDQFKTIDELKDYIGRNINESEMWIYTYYRSKWQYLDNLYRGIRTKNDNIPAWRSNMFVNVGFGLVNTEHARAMGGLYSKNDFFALSSRKDKTESGKDAGLSALAMEKLMQAQQAEIPIYSRFYEALLDSLIKSIGVIKWTHQFIKNEKETEYYDVDTGKIKKITKKTKKSLPLVESINPFDFLIDKEATSLDDAAFVCHRIYIHPQEILDNPSFNIPSEIEKWKEEWQSISPRPRKIELYEYWTNDEVITITGAMQEIKVSPEVQSATQSWAMGSAGGSYIIRKHRNPYKHGLKPFVLFIKYPSQRSPYGYGTLEMIADNQEYLNNLANATADNVLLAINKSFFVNERFATASDGPVALGPGKLIKIRGIQSMEDIKPIELGTVGMDTLKQMEMIDSWNNQIIGDLDMADSPATKTATQSRIIDQKANERQSAFIEYNKENALKRILRMWISNNQQFVSVEDALDMIGTQAKDLNLEGKNIDFDCEFDFVMTGDSGLTNKMLKLQDLQNFLTLMPQVAALPPQLFDVSAFLKYFAGLFDLPKGILINQPTQLNQPNQTQIDPKIKTQIAGEISDMANKQGMTPEEWIETIAKQLNMQPEQVVAEAIKVGGMQNLLNKVQGGGVAPLPAPANG